MDAANVAGDGEAHLRVAFFAEFADDQRQQTHAERVPRGLVGVLVVVDVLDRAPPREQLLNTR